MGSIDSPKVKITQKLLNSWRVEIESDKSSKTIKNLINAFHAAFLSVSDSKDSDSKYVAEGGTIFNDILELCITCLPSAIRKFLKLSGNEPFQADKCKKFKKIKGALNFYSMDVVKVLENVTSKNIRTILLKHLSILMPFLTFTKSFRKNFLKLLLDYWSTGDYTVRIVAYYCILSIASNKKNDVLDALIKSMYMKFVKNSKFLSPSTITELNFMIHSFTEICLLDSKKTYYHMFLYVRQLAITLRGAMTLKKKENFEAVYNWQFINSLRLWAQVVSSAEADSLLRSLMYPLIQIIVGVIKLVPTEKFYPLRLHCVQLLLNISKDIGIFVPFLTFALEILSSSNSFQLKGKIGTIKPIPLICTLRASKSQLQDNNYKSSLLDTLYQLILESGAENHYKIYFPEEYFVCMIRIKQFISQCQNSNYSQKMKQLTDKIKEDKKLNKEARAYTTHDLRNMEEILNWENCLKGKESSLKNFYNMWKKFNANTNLDV